MTGGKTSPNIDTARLRTLFFATLARVAPQTLVSLRDSVLPVFVSASANGGTPIYRHRGYPKDAVAWTGSPDLQAAVEEWAAGLRMNLPWVTSSALRQVQIWATLPDEGHRNPLRWLANQTHMMRLPEPREVATSLMSDSLPSWWPVGQTWTAYREMLWAIINDRLQAYKELVDADYVAWETQQPYPHAAQHVRWLVLYQVIGPPNNYSRIGRQEHVGRRSVTDGVKKIAGLLDVDLREPQLGAPKKVPPTT